VTRRGLRIKSIWIAEVSSQGASNLLNEDIKYDDGKQFLLPRLSVDGGGVLIAFSITI